MTAKRKKTALYRCPNCGHTERIKTDSTPVCEKCSWEFMGIGRMGFPMDIVLRVVDNQFPDAKKMVPKNDTDALQ